MSFKMRNSTTETPTGYLRLDTQTIKVPDAEKGPHCFEVETFVHKSGESFVAVVNGHHWKLFVSSIDKYREMLRYHLSREVAPYVKPSPTRHIAIDLVRHDERSVRLEFWPVLLQQVNELGAMANALGPPSPEAFLDDDWKPRQWQNCMPIRRSNLDAHADVVPWSLETWNRLCEAKASMATTAELVRDVVAGGGE